ncbi:choline ABC transporter permease subunit [Gammaproteobacteria bacterium]|nr:choline ABC transporter permease subunit [Gammaproteobacteria bacterium]
MDPISEALSAEKLPLGKWVEKGVDVLLDNGAWLFDGIAATLDALINGLIDLLLWFPPIALIGLIALIGWRIHRSLKLAIGVAISLTLVLNLGYWQETCQTVGLISIATLVCLAIGIPLGIACGHRPRLYAAVQPVLDLMQTIPTFVYLIPTLIMFGLGVVPGLISTVIFALPAPVRLTMLGISSVPKSLLEAGDAFGASPAQRLWKVELPYATPSIMAGVNQCIMLSLSMVVIAAMVGAPGLGVPVLRALNQVNIAKGFEAGLAIVVVAIILDRLCRRPQRHGTGRQQ